MASDERWWLGIDVGGTFTDLIAVSRETGEIRDMKVLTTKTRQEEVPVSRLDTYGWYQLSEEISATPIGPAMPSVA